MSFPGFTGIVKWDYDPERCEIHDAPLNRKRQCWQCEQVREAVDHLLSIRDRCVQADGFCDHLARQMGEGR